MSARIGHSTAALRLSSPATPPVPSKTAVHAWVSASGECAPALQPIAARADPALRRAIGGLPVGNPKCGSASGRVSGIRSKLISRLPSAEISTACRSWRLRQQMAHRLRKEKNSVATARCRREAKSECVRDDSGWPIPGAASAGQYVREGRIARSRHKEACWCLT